MRYILAISALAVLVLMGAQAQHEEPAPTQATYGAGVFSVSMPKDERTCEDYLLEVSSGEQPPDDRMYVDRDRCIYRAEVNWTDLASHAYVKHAGGLLEIQTPLDELTCNVDMPDTDSYIAYAWTMNDWPAYKYGIWTQLVNPVSEVNSNVAVVTYSTGDGIWTSQTPACQ